LSSLTVRVLQPNAAGIDIGATEHFVAVPADRDPQPVRSFSAFTADLERLADWLSACRIDAVVMESTGSFWIPLFELLEARGFRVWLVDPYGLKQVPGRKSDVKDCQWLQYLHSVGLLSPAFRPEQQVVLLRSYLRQRATLVQGAAREIMHMQAALTLMNLKLQHVISDISGVTGMAIIRAILDGERDPLRLAALRDFRCRNDAATIAAALTGQWRDDHLFQLKQAVALYDSFQQLIADCDQAIMDCLGSFPSRAATEDLPPARRTRKRDRKSRPADLRAELYRICGVDLTSIDGIDDASALALISEVGTDMSRWPSAKHFASWLRLSPARDVSGGKVLKRKARPGCSRATTIFRMCAQSLERSQTALGAFLRRKKARHGPAKAITAAAHKLARIFYALLSGRTHYTDPGIDDYERRYRDRAVASLGRRAKALGLELVAAPGT
jgi:transposase